MLRSIQTWLFLCVICASISCLTGGGFAQTAGTSATVDEFVGSWAGNWQSDGSPSTLTVSKNAEGRPAVRYTQRANGWNYIGVIKDNQLYFSYGDYHFWFDRPKGNRLNGSMSAPGGFSSVPGGFSSRISMTKTSGSSSAAPVAPAAPTPASPDVHWAVGTWAGKLPFRQNPDRALEIRSASETAGVTGGWGLGVGMTGDVQITIQDKLIRVVTQADSIVELALISDGVLEGNFILKDGKRFPITMNKIK